MNEAHRNYLDHARYDLAGAGLGSLLTEMHIHAATGAEPERQRALALLVEACIVAFGVTKNLRHPDLALQAAHRAHEAAKAAADPALLAFAGQRRAQALQRVGAFRRAGTVLEQALNNTQEFADPTAADTSAAEGVGLLHLAAAMNAARAGYHLAAAEELGARTGERNALGQHFGPANLGVWRISIGVELGDGAAAYDRASGGIDPATLASADRVAMMRADSARALAQEGADATRKPSACSTAPTAPRRRAYARTPSCANCSRLWPAAPAAAPGSSPASATASE